MTGLGAQSRWNSIKDVYDSYFNPSFCVSGRWVSIWVSASVESELSTFSSFTSHHFTPSAELRPRSFWLVESL